MTKSITSEDIRNIRRKLLRYLFFAKRDQKNIGEVTGSDDQVIVFFEGKPKFPGWDSFESHWDIGLKDDPIALENRPEKWFLKDAHSDEVVTRPKNYWEQEADRLNTPHWILRELESQRRGITLQQFNKVFAG